MPRWAAVEGPYRGAVHPRQGELPPEIEEVWLAALADAEIHPDEALQYVLDGEQGSNGYGARYLHRGLHIYPDGEADEIHPLLTEMNDDACIDAYRVVEYEYFQTHVAPLRQAAKTGEASGDWDASWDVRKGHVKDGSFNWLWPNFMVVIYPGPSALSTNLIVPVGVDRTLAVYEFFFSEEVTDEERGEITGYIDLIQREDIPLCESVQRGMKSGFFDQGTLMLTRENGIRHFQRLVHKCVTAPA